MRFIKYSFLFWLACLPLFYAFGLPKVIAAIEKRTQAESFAKCQHHLMEEKIAYVAAAVIKPERADEYCHCVSDNIVFSKADLMDLAMQRQPEELGAALAPIVEGCTRELERSIANAVNTGPKPRSTWEPDGTETVHFD